MSFKDLSLNEKLANIGMEVYRMKRWQKVNDKYYQASFLRALDFLKQTIEETKNFSTLKELARVKSLLLDAYSGGKEFRASLDDLIKYFDYFIKTTRK